MVDAPAHRRGACVDVGSLTRNVQRMVFHVDPSFFGCAWRSGATLVKLGFASALAIGAVSQTVDAQTLHDQAVASARAGRFDSAILVLQKLVKEQPQRAVYRHDLITVLSWAQRHAEAFDFSQSMVLDDSVPDYVLAAIGQSAQDLGQYARAEQAYRLLLQRQPRSEDAARGLSRALAAAQARTETAPARTEAPVTTGTDKQQASADGVAAAQERNAQHIREAAALLDTDFSAARYRLSDAALAENHRLIEQAMAAQDNTQVVRLRRDRVVALRDRGWNQQAWDAFVALDKDEAGATPAYVVAAAAQASLQLRRPEQAKALFQRALQSEPDNVGWLSALMFAELESENFAAAQQVASRRLALAPDSIDARRMQTMLLRFTDRMREAQAAMQSLLAERPDHAGLWLEQADLFLQRGLPRAAQERYQAVLKVEPGNVQARAGLVQALWAQGAIAQAADHIAELRTQAPEHPAVQRLLQAWQRRARPVLTSAATQGFGQGAVQGNDDLVWESSLYSGQSDAGWRGFVNHHYAEARFNGATANHERLGAGLEWTQRDVQLSAELGRDLRNGEDVVWAAGAAWQIDDQLSMRARHESQTNDFPLKGRTPNAEGYLGAPTHLHANKSLVGTAYRWNESRRLAADVARFAFNDGNRRHALSVTWFERLYSANGRTLDLQTAAYASSNTLRDAIYFNPKHDVAWSATLTGDWLTLRRYERSFNQRLALTLGTYRQTNAITQPGGEGRQKFGWNDFQEVRYEHEWRWNADFDVRYGIGARRFPYDGVYESKRFVFANLNWRL